MSETMKHPALVGSAGALVVLAGASIVRPLPWPIWATWVALTAIGIIQVTRGRRR